MYKIIYDDYEVTIFDKEHPYNGPLSGVIAFTNTSSLFLKLDSEEIYFEPTVIPETKQKILSFRCLLSFKRKEDFDQINTYILCGSSLNKELNPWSITVNSNEGPILVYKNLFLDYNKGFSHSPVECFFPLDNYENFRLELRATFELNE